VPGDAAIKSGFWAVALILSIIEPQIQSYKSIIRTGNGQFIFMITIDLPEGGLAQNTSF
jgi:hypothetical protein